MTQQGSLLSNKAWSVRDANQYVAGLYFSLTIALKFFGSSDLFSVWSSESSGRQTVGLGPVVGPSPLYIGRRNM